MLYYEGLSCPVCQKLFEASDDMVVCPVCGLPHHRHCWTSEGHCHEEVLHGTEQQWSREKAELHDEDDSDDEENVVSTAPIHEYTPAFTPQSVAQNTDIEFLGEIPLSNFSAMVKTNLRYYLPRFLHIEKNKRSGGWNWAAFIFGWRWLLYRKQYGLGIALFAARILLVLSLFVLLSFLGNDALANYISAEDMVAATNEISASLLEDPTLSPFATMWSLYSWLYISSRFFLGMFGNRLYYKSCRQKIQKAKAKIPNLSAAELTAFGGTAIGVALVFHLILEFLPMILSYFVFPY